MYSNINFYRAHIKYYEMSESCSNKAIRNDSLHYIVYLYVMNFLKCEMEAVVPSPLLLTEFSWTSIGVMAWMNYNLHENSLLYFTIHVLTSMVV